MANRFWVGGAGTWNTTSTANWSTTTGGASGASAPTTSDVAIFDANSGSTYTVTLGENVTVNTVTANAMSNGTFDFVTFNISISGNGANVFRSAAIAYLGTPLVNLTYASSTGTRTITPGAASTSTNPLNLNVQAGSDIVSLTSGSTGRYGNINFTGFSGSLTFTSTTSATSLYGSLTLSSTMTMPSQTGSLTMLATSIKTITVNTKTIDQPIVFNGIGGTWQFQDALTQGSTRAFTITDGTVQLKNGVTSTVGVFATSGTSRKFLQSTLAGTQATLSQASGTVNAAYLDIQDINATGGATWNSFTTSGNVDDGNNTGWNFGGTPVLVSEVEYRIRPFTQTRRF